MPGMMLKLGLDLGRLRAGERVCVAVSGGADSVALLLGLVEANTPSAQNKEPLGVGLSAVHVHHGLRGAEADGDEAFVVALCERMGVPLTVSRVDTAGRQAVEGEGVEEAARELRYGVFRQLAVDVVVTAHTLDDQAETVMMKLLRGAWTEGLGGVSPMVGEAANSQQRTANSEAERSTRIVRPMLGVRRVEVEAFLRGRGQAWREDATNRDLSLTRNRVRHELMPMLRSFNPNADQMLANVAELARGEQAHWDAEVKRLVAQVSLPGKPVRGGGRAVGTAVGEREVAVELEKLRAMDAATRRRVVRGLADVVGGRMTFEETAKVMALAGFGGHAGVTGKVGSRLELRAGLRVERTARELRFWRQG